MPRVYVSTVINAAAHRVWAQLRDFNGLPSWHPRVVQSRIELDAAADRVGCIRDLRLETGAAIREQLLALSDYEYAYTYSILESPMGVENYLATLKLTPITDGDRCFAEWTADFDCRPEDAAELAENIGTNVFQDGFNALKRRFGG
jgi:Polyketide cyclase / dehydrase and lipid transport